jgi:hypothetical protein
MVSDPKPKQAIFGFHSKGTELLSNASRSEASYFFEVKRRMA